MTLTRHGTRECPKCHALVRLKEPLATFIGFGIVLVAMAVSFVVIANVPPPAPAVPLTVAGLMLASWLVAAAVSPLELAEGPKIPDIPL